MSVVVPTLDRERELLNTFEWIIACDEVGRGAIAGPVVVGAASMGRNAIERGIPDGLRDSKLIPKGRRADVAQRVATFVDDSALGWAEAGEVDEHGIMRALGLAASRAIAPLIEAMPNANGVILLDGNYDYITAVTNFGVPVIPVVKGDRDCASAAAASVLAKVSRDAYMIELDRECPAYGWASNMGYASAFHKAALIEHGLSRHHRASWAIVPETLF